VSKRADPEADQENRADKRSRSGAARVEYRNAGNRKRQVERRPDEPAIGVDEFLAIRLGAW